MMRWCCLCLVVCCWSAWGVVIVEAAKPKAQTPVASKSKVPKPSEVLGFPLGKRPASHGAILRYLERLAASSERIILEQMGKTHEGRRLVVVTISDASHIKRLKAIKAAHQKLGRPLGVSVAARKKLLQETPGLAWLGYSIHGDEISGADAVMALAYRLVTGEDPLTRKLRKTLVIRLDPCENPDGRSRYLPMLRAFSNATPQTNPSSISHAATWPLGRGNHYLFDLNRDWFSLVHPESRGRAKMMSSWWPQLVVDAHEMDDNRTFLFSPPRAPFNPHLPSYMKRWWARFAKDQGRAFDRKGWGYYRGEWNEELFPGYGSSWPLYGGAISILYEQVSTFGQTIQLRSGLRLTYKESVERQLISSLANLGTFANHRKEILTAWSNGRLKAMQSKDKWQAFVLLRQPDPGRALRLVRTLKMQGIEIHTNQAPVAVTGLHDMWGRRHGQVLPKGSFLIKVAQPLAPLVRNLLHFHSPLKKRFLRTERKWLERGRGSKMYETTAWSMPLSYAVKGYWLPQVPTGQWTLVEQAQTPTGGVFPVAKRPKRAPHKRLFGYVYKCQTDASLLLTARLLHEGFQVRVARDPFVLEGRSFPRGSLLLRTRQNPSTLRRRLLTLSRVHRVRVYQTHTALSDKGPDLGGNRFEVLLKPKIAVLTGAPVSTASYGFLWHLLDKELRLPFVGLPVSALSESHLAPYNVLILPQATSDDAYSKQLGTDGWRQIKRWVKAGGTLIAIGNAVPLVSHPKQGITKVRLRRQLVGRFPSVVLGPSALALDRTAPMRAVGLRAVYPAPPRISKSFLRFIRGKKPMFKGLKGPKRLSQKPLSATSRPRRTKPTHPYDVLPVVGPGARPFLREKDAYYRFPKSIPLLTQWASPLIPPGAGKKGRLKMYKWADRRLRRFRPQGAFLRVDLSRTHWLTFGTQAKLPVHFKRSSALIADMSVEIAGRFANLKQLHLSGLLWPEAAGRIAKTAYLTRESVSKGQVILFADHPVFRGITWGARRLFVNALLFGPGLGSEWSRWPTAKHKHTHRRRHH